MCALAHPPPSSSSSSFHRFFPEDTLWKILIGVCRGLRHIHEKRILHRDIKAPNIFLDTHGNVKIGDFGLGRVLGPHSAFARTKGEWHPRHTPPPLTHAPSRRARSHSLALSFQLARRSTFRQSSCRSKSTTSAPTCGLLDASCMYQPTYTQLSTTPQQPPAAHISRVFVLACLRLTPFAAAAAAVARYELAALRPPFMATNQLALAQKIVHEKPAPLPRHCSMQLQFVVFKLLEKVRHHSFVLCFR